MATKCLKNKRGIRLSSKKKLNYKSKIRDNIDPDQIDNKYPL